MIRHDDDRAEWMIDLALACMVIGAGLSVGVVVVAMVLVR